MERIDFFLGGSNALVHTTQWQSGSGQVFQLVVCLICRIDRIARQFRRIDCDLDRQHNHDENQYRQSDTRQSQWRVAALAPSGQWRVSHFTPRTGDTTDGPNGTLRAGSCGKAGLGLDPVRETNGALRNPLSAE